MTNKEIINFECERLENIRQYFIGKSRGGYGEKMGFFVKELGEIIYELETKITDTKVELVLGK